MSKTCVYILSLDSAPISDTEYCTTDIGLAIRLRYKRALNGADMVLTIYKRKKIGLRYDRNFYSQHVSGMDASRLQLDVKNQAS